MANILYYGSLPDRLNIGVEEITITEALGTIRELLTSLHERGETRNQYLAEDKLQVTINKKFSDPESALNDNDEIAIISIGLQ
jgi:molybdopterin converting factor small subunit